MKEKSEFGKGLVVNLVKFSEHFMTPTFQRIKNVIFYQSQSEEKRAKIISDNPPSDCNYGNDFKNNIRLFLDYECKVRNGFEEGISSMITRWANGSTDHLYEIEVPEGKDWNQIRKLVVELKDKGLDMGHGFKDIIYKYDDVLKLWRLTKKICILIDKKLGLKPDWGES